MRILLYSLLLTLSACTSGINLENVNIAPLFHDNSSKVWLIDKVWHNGQDVSPARTNFKDVLIFYKNGNVLMQPLNSLGNKLGKKGTFTIDPDLNTIIMEYKLEKWFFSIENPSLERITLHPKEGSAIPYVLEIVPLPEL